MHHARGGVSHRFYNTKVPVEVWTRIGDLITSPADLINLASISPQALSAAADLARCLWVMEICLVDVVGSVPPIQGTTESTRHHDIQKYFYDVFPSCGAHTRLVKRSSRAHMFHFHSLLCALWNHKIFMMIYDKNRKLEVLISGVSVQLTQLRPCTKLSRLRMDRCLSQIQIVLVR